MFSWNFGKKNNTQKQINKIKKIVDSREDCIDMKKTKEFRNFVDEKVLNYNIFRIFKRSKFSYFTLF